MHKLRVLICDDQEHVRNSHESYLHQFKKSAFYPVTELSESAEKGIELAKEAVANGTPFDLVLMDVDFSRGGGAGAMDGFTGANAINRISPQSVIVMISAYSTEDNLGLALKTPWVDKFLRRGTFTQEELLDACIFALVRRLHAEGKLLKEKETLFTQSSVVQDYLKAVDRVTADRPVVIFGETGTGKELTAKRINANARIATGQETRPLITINCGGISESLSHSEIFGHVRGAFTGAHQDRKGQLELADGGDVFLDELQNAPIALQRLLIRVLEYQEFVPLGGTKPKRIEVRFIAAVNQSITETIKVGNLLPDLLARLQKGYLVIPPLRERPGDVRALAEHFLKTAGQADKTFSVDALDFLESQPWPTNIRGLETVVTEAVRSTKIPTISADAIKRLPILAQMAVEARRIEAANADEAVVAEAGAGAVPIDASSASAATSAVDASVNALANHCLQSGMPLADAVEALEKVVLTRLWQQEQTNARVARRSKLSDTTTRRKLAEYGITQP